MTKDLILTLRLYLKIQQFQIKNEMFALTKKNSKLAWNNT